MMPEMKMPAKVMRCGVLVCAALGAFTLTATAQEGHPLTGSWHGDWGTSPTQRNPVLIYMRWDSKNIVGSINPGPKAAPLKVATLDPSKWTVHLEGDGKDAAGNPVHIVVDGKLDNLGSYNRTMAGTWMQGAVKGDFKVTRD
jgi:hypothetical protein